MQFAINNWYLFLALGVILGLLVGPSLMRLVYGVKTLAPFEAVRLMNHENGVVLDVCEPTEFRSGHIAHAVNVPLGELKGQAQALEKYRNRPVIVACRSGNRSVKGAIALRRAGFPTVYSLAGGLAAWEGASLPVER